MLNESQVCRCVRWMRGKFFSAFTQVYILKYLVPVFTWWAGPTKSSLLICRLFHTAHNNTRHVEAVTFCINVCMDVIKPDINIGGQFSLQFCVLYITIIWCIGSLPTPKKCVGYLHRRVFKGKLSMKSMHQVRNGMACARMTTVHCTVSYFGKIFRSVTKFEQM